ncbi:hypothetical protein GKODMF_10440 [Candidatus Electrothrix gigas]
MDKNILRADIAQSFYSFLLTNTIHLFKFAH